MIIPHPILALGGAAAALGIYIMNKSGGAAAPLAFGQPSEGGPGPGGKDDEPGAVPPPPIIINQGYGLGGGAAPFQQDGSEGGDGFGSMDLSGFEPATPLSVLSQATFVGGPLDPNEGTTAIYGKGMRLPDPIDVVPDRPVAGGSKFSAGLKPAALWSGRIGLTKPAPRRVVVGSTLATPGPGATLAQAQSAYQAAAQPRDYGRSLASVSGAQTSTGPGAVAVAAPVATPFVGSQIGAPSAAAIAAGKKHVGGGQEF